MKNTQRAVRRHHRRRMSIRAMTLSAVRGIPLEDRLQYALGLYQNMQKCSCYMCGHRRKWNGPTMQERRRKGIEQFDLRDALAIEAEGVEVFAVTVSDDQDWERFCCTNHWGKLKTLSSLGDVT